jgi:transposase-like protein
MKNILDFKTLMEFTAYFHDEATCVKHFTDSRFRNGEYCPHCGHDKIYKCANGKRYHCAKCKQDFTVRTKTVFGESKLPLRKWYMVVYLLSTSSKGVSSVQLAKHVGVTQKTAWFMAHRLRSAMKANKGQLFGTVEVDETYVGGQIRNMHKSKVDRDKLGTGGKGKAIVAGIRSRTGEVRAKVVMGVESGELHPLIQKEVALGSTVCTDEHRAYSGLAGYTRKAVSHSGRIYVEGDAHTNGIESFWALFKRAYHGIYHQMSRKHLQRYVNECAFRVNRKTFTLAEMFSEVMQKTADGKRLPYKQLIA